MSGWVVRKRASALERGDRFIFSEDLGGEGETVTVESCTKDFGTIGILTIQTEELDFPLEVTYRQMVTMATEED